MRTKDVPSPAETTPPPMPPRRPDPTRRHQTLTLGVAAGVMVILGGVLVLAAPTVVHAEADADYQTARIQVDYLLAAEEAVRATYDAAHNPAVVSAGKLKAILAASAGYLPDRTCSMLSSQAAVFAMTIRAHPGARARRPIVVEKPSSTTEELERAIRVLARQAEAEVRAMTRTRQVTSEIDRASTMVNDILERVVTGGPTTGKSAALPGLAQIGAGILAKYPRADQVTKAEFTAAIRAAVTAAKAHGPVIDRLITYLVKARALRHSIDTQSSHRGQLSISAAVPS